MYHLFVTQHAAAHRSRSAEHKTWLARYKTQQLEDSLQLELANSAARLLPNSVGLYPASPVIDQTVEGQPPAKRACTPLPSPSQSPDMSSDNNVEANHIVNLVKPALDYYHQFTNSVRMCDHHAIAVFGRCYVNINDQDVEAVVGGTTMYGENQMKDRRYILCYILYDQQGSFLGFFSSGRVTRRESGWTADDVTTPINVFDIPVPGVPQSVLMPVVPLCVVLTGTFPELGGGSDLSLGKDALKLLVEGVPNARVVSAISGKTTHLVIGQNPGQKKIDAASKQGNVQQMDLQSFREVLSARVQMSAAVATVVHPAVALQQVYRIIIYLFLFYFLFINRGIPCLTSAGRSCCRLCRSSSCFAEGIPDHHIFISILLSFY
jgi:hypothetical protein